MHGDIERLAADELEKIDRHLIALEELRDDPTFVTLREARLTGVTKRRWAAASAAVMSATSRLGKSRDTVSEAIRLLRADPPDPEQAERLLRGRSIPLTPAETPKQDRRPPASTSSEPRFSLHAVKDFVADDLRTARRVVDGVADVVAAVRPRLASLTARLDDADSRLGSRLGLTAGNGTRAELVALRRGLDDVWRLLAADPLALIPVGASGPESAEGLARLDAIDADLTRLSGRLASGGELPPPPPPLAASREPTGCVRPDCPAGGGGKIDADGFCDSCQRSPATTPVTTPVITPVTSRAAGEPCPRDDCPGGGILDEDGFCDVCNRAAPQPQDPAAGAAAPPIWYSVPWESPDRTGHGEFPALTFPPGIPARSLGRAPLGLGLVPIPAIPARDPDSLVRDDDDLVVEAKRRCPNRECRAAVGRSLDGAAGQPEDRCPVCGTTYSFRPPLHPGDFLGQYQVRGCVGYGGQGWVYLASDLNLDGDPVALKGQRGYASAAANAAAAAERRTLIELRHPDIVDIRNFVKHRDPETGRLNGYIVLEFLAGESLAEKIKTGRLPVAEAIAYILAVLPALGYLHDSGLVYGDFKPANVMQVRDRIKLIDLGGVRRIGDSAVRHSVVTSGFQAPEVGPGGLPSVNSDLYTVGRTLAVLTAPFAPTGEYATRLPGPGEIAVFSRYESFYRFLCRATAADPRRRFGSAAEMAGQLVGVLREVVALEGGGPLPPLSSALFTPERDVVTVDPRPARDTALALPVPQPDETDPAAAFLSTVTTTDPDEVMAQLRHAPRTSIEVAFRRTLARMGQPGFAEADAALEIPPGADPADWRFVWYRGLLDLAAGQAGEAWHSFAMIRDLMPGELAPKLALAVCAELLDTPAVARHYYQTVWRTGQGFVGAAFGVARTYAKEPGSGGTEDAIDVLESIPESLRHHATARIKALELRLGRPGLDERGLREAAKRLRELDLDDEQGLRQRIKVWQAARTWLGCGGDPTTGDPLLDVPLRPDAIGFALEKAYLRLRRHVPERRDRVDLVKSAHAARPRTRWRGSQVARDVTG